MTHQVSPHAIVGLGALGRALESFLQDTPTESPAAVLFAVKAFDLEAALREHSTKWPAEIPFVTLCNGYIWPVFTKLKPVLKDRPIRVGMTTIGSTIKSNGTIEVFSVGATTAWGNWEPSGTRPTESELRLLRRFPKGQWIDDVRPLIRQKWIFNTVINTLAAAHRLPANAALKKHQAETSELCAESIKLADKIWPDLPWDISADDLLKKLWDVVDATARNENSMARDIRLNRRTESDYLAGIAEQYEGFPALKHLHRLITQKT
jgi:ketopantoate reductase